MAFKLYPKGKKSESSGKKEFFRLKSMFETKHKEDILKIVYVENIKTIIIIITAENWLEWSLEIQCLLEANMSGSELAAIQIFLNSHSSSSVLFISNDVLRASGSEFVPFPVYSSRSLDAGQPSLPGKNKFVFD